MTPGTTTRRLVAAMALLWAAHGALALDTDGDGAVDAQDNCINDANPAQTDSNGDDFGNACDADLNDDGVVNVVDLGILRKRFFTDDADADFNVDGVVNVVDLGIMRSRFFEAPGPSGVAIANTPLQLTRGLQWGQFQLAFGDAHDPGRRQSLVRARTRRPSAQLRSG